MAKRHPRDIEERVLRKLAGRLRPLGQVAMQYITASLHGPMTAAVPDLIFVPYSGPYADIPHMIQFKVVATDDIPQSTLWAAAQERAAIAEANPGSRIRFAVATNAILSDAQDHWCEALGLTVFDIIDDVGQLVEDVREWASV